MTDGKGWIQQWGQPIEEIRKGDVIWIPAGVKHWHGATPSTAMTHCVSESALARMRCYEGKKITLPSRGFEV